MKTYFIRLSLFSLLLLSFSICGHSQIITKKINSSCPGNPGCTGEGGGENNEAINSTWPHKGKMVNRPTFLAWDQVKGAKDYTLNIIEVKGLLQDPIVHSETIGSTFMTVDFGTIGLSSNKKYQYQIIANNGNDSTTKIQSNPRSFDLEESSTFKSDHESIISSLNNQSSFINDSKIGKALQKANAFSEKGWHLEAYKIILDCQNEAVGQLHQVSLALDRLQVKIDPPR